MKSYILCLQNIDICILIESYGWISSARLVEIRQGKGKLRAHSFGLSYSKP